MSRSSALGALTVGAGVAIALAACSSTSAGPVSSPATAGRLAHHTGTGTSTSTSTSTGSGCHPDITPQICVTVAITGARTVAGTGQTTAPVPADASPKTTCAQLASWNDTEYDLGGSLTDVAGHTVQWDEDLGSFHGPARYDLTRSGFYVTVDGTGFTAYHDRAASVTVAHDDAVTYQFDRLTSDSGTISGTLRWTCLDPQ